MRNKPFETCPVKIYAGERQSGKSTILVKRSAETGKRIVTSSKYKSTYIKLLANYLGLKIPEPISLATFILNTAQTGAPKDKMYLIDDLESCLQQLGVEAVTLDSDYIGYLKPENEKNNKTSKSFFKKERKK